MKLKYNGWDLDSPEELYFCWWLEELLDHKYIKSFNRAETIPIYNPEKLCFGEHCRKVLREFNYTPDFIVEWYPKANGIFFLAVGQEYSKDQVRNVPFISMDKKTSLIDIKGLFQGTRYSSSITFPITQKFLFHEKKIFVDKIIPLGNKGLFAKTFTPKKYLLTETGKQRKINWKVSSVLDYTK
jgi:hypothetical protein